MPRYETIRFHVRQRPDDGKYLSPTFQLDFPSSDANRTWKRQKKTPANARRFFQFNDCDFLLPDDQFSIDKIFRISDG